MLGKSNDKIVGLSRLRCRPEGNWTWPENPPDQMRVSVLMGKSSHGRFPIVILWILGGHLQLNSMTKLNVLLEQPVASKSLSKEATGQKAATALIKSGMCESRVGMKASRTIQATTQFNFKHLRRHVPAINSSWLWLCFVLAALRRSLAFSCQQSPRLGVCV